MTYTQSGKSHYMIGALSRVADDHSDMVIGRLIMQLLILVIIGEPTM